MKSLLQRLSDEFPECGNEHHEIKGNTNLIDELLLVLSSRPRMEQSENISLVNSSVLNYGIRDTFTCDTPNVLRNSIMQQRIELSLSRFEPRLINVMIYSDNQENHKHFFVIEADTNNGPVRYRLMWDDILSHFIIVSEG